MEEEILTIILDKLYINREEFFISGKREFVEARMLFIYFFIQNYKGRKHGMFTVLSKFLKKCPSTTLHYQLNHFSVLKTDKMYKIKFSLLNQYFKYEYLPLTTTC